MAFTLCGPTSSRLLRQMWGPVIYKELLSVAQLQKPHCVRERPQIFPRLRPETLPVPFQVLNANTKRRWLVLKTYARA